VYLKLIWLDSFPIAEARVTVWIMFVCMNLAQGFLSRSKTRSIFLINPWTNKWMIGGVFTSFCLLIIGVYVPGLRDIFDNLPVGGISWAYILGGVGGHIVLNEISKLNFRWHLWVFSKRTRAAVKARTATLPLEDVLANTTE